MVKKPSFLLHFSAISTVFIIGIGVVGAPLVSGSETVPSFETRNPGILPISPFYFLKEWRRGIIRSFTKDPLSQIVFELKTLDEKAAELKKVRDLRPDDIGVITDAIKNYKNSQIRLKSSIKEAGISEETSKNKEKLVQEIVRKVSEHERYLEMLSKSYSENENLHPLTERAQEMSVEVVKASKVIPKEKFENIAREYLTEKTIAKIIQKEEVLENPTATLLGMDDVSDSISTTTPTTSSDGVNTLKATTSDVLKQ